MDVKKCPFCGGAPKVMDRVSDIDGAVYVVAKCCNRECHARPSVIGTSEQEAVERWNKREEPDMKGMIIKRIEDEECTGAMCPPGGCGGCDVGRMKRELERLFEVNND